MPQAPRRKFKWSLVFWILLGPAIAIGGILAISHFGMMTIVGQTYYRPLAERIVEMPAFRSELGSPINIDDSGVSCTAAANGRYISTSDCTLPVQGSRESGTVHAQITARPSSLHGDLWLHVGSKSIHASL
jgi:hypothetical protein